MAHHNDAVRFLQTVFPGAGSYGLFANLGPPVFVRSLAGLDGERDCYFSIAAFPPAYRGPHRQDKALEVRVLVVDDIGSKLAAGAVRLALGRPSAEVETSAGNFQWTYRLTTAVPLADWAGVVAAVERLIGRGARLEGRDAVHLFRLPMGVNSKPGRGGFRVRLIGLDATQSLDVAELTAGLGGLEPSGAAALPAGPGSGPGPASAPRVRDIGGLLGLIPNPDLDYDAWIAVAQRARALALDDAAAWEAFDAWSARSTAKYDAAETARRWATVKPTRTTGLELQAMAEAADAGGFAAWAAREAAGAFDDGVAAPSGGPGAAGSEGPAGQVKFKRGAKGEILKTMDNAVRGIGGLGIVCAHDEFHHRIMITQEGEGDSSTGSGGGGGTGRAAKTPLYVGRLTDNAILMLRVALERAFGKDFGREHVGDAVVALALENGFNPVCDMLAGAAVLWDGVARLDRLGPDYFKAEDTALVRAFFRKTMIAAVRRARQPGCKFDQILVCESPEGWNKSTAWAVLAGEGNFSDVSILGRDTREVQEALGDIWIHENAELAGMSRAEVEHVKNFASSVADKARPAYGRFVVTQPRQSIEVGTTNATSYLLSGTGNRRFWTCQLTAPVDIGGLRRDRLQLWGEAAAAEAAGETLVLDPGLWGAAAAEQEKRRVIDPWEVMLEELRDVPPGGMAVGVERIEMSDGGERCVTNASISDYLLGTKRQLLQTSAWRRIGEVMLRQGWVGGVFKLRKKTVRGYRKRSQAQSGASVTVTSAENVTENLF